jgi:Amino acid permease
MLALLFSVQSVSSVQGTGYAIPIAQLYFDAVGKKLTLMCLTVIALAQFMASVTAFTASSRLFYALGRDNAMPFKRQFLMLNRFQAPYVGVWVSVFVACVISCAYIGSVIAVRRFPPSCIKNHARSNLPARAVQCHFVFCCDCSNVKLSATHHNSRLLAFSVRRFLSCPHLSLHSRSYLYANKNSLSERGPFTLGRWSWVINFVSFLVRTGPL